MQRRPLATSASCPDLALTRRGRGQATHAESRGRGGGLR